MFREAAGDSTDRRVLQGKSGFGRTNGSASVSGKAAGKTDSKLRGVR
jgi:hypothetical protein